MHLGKWAKARRAVPERERQSVHVEVTGWEEYEWKGTHADVESGVEVVLDLDGVPGVLVGERERVARLGRDWRSRGEVEEPLSKRGRGRVVLRFGEGRHRESQREREVRGLQAAVREVPDCSDVRNFAEKTGDRLDERGELELALER